MKAIPRQHRSAPQAGFSIIELMIAMVVTVIISGAIFGLLTSGQSAFRVQPERADRQQNIRTAMDLIVRDVAAAGVEMPGFVQAFRTGLNSIGPASPSIPPPPGGANADELEVVANTTGFGNEPVCGQPLLNGVSLGRNNRPFEVPTRVIVLFPDNSWSVREVTASVDSGPLGTCTGATHPLLTFAPEANPCSPGTLGFGNAGTDCTTTTAINFGEVVHYRINVGADGMPNLERDASGAGFQVVARGIEDLQVQYVQANGAISNNAPAVVAGPPVVYNTLITEVRITLVARAATARIQGATVGATGTAAMRGSLFAQVTPRQALFTLTQQDPNPLWN